MQSDHEVYPPKGLLSTVVLVSVIAKVPIEPTLPIDDIFKRHKIYSPSKVQLQCSFLGQW